MFFENLLAPLARPLLVEAAHRAMRVLSHRDGADFMIKGLRRQAGTDPAAKVVLDVIALVEDMEGQPIRELTDRQVNKYARDLAAIVQTRARQELHFGEDDEARAASILDHLRSSSMI